MNSFSEICFDENSIIDSLFVRSEHEIEVAEDIMNWYYKNIEVVNSLFETPSCIGKSFWQSVIDVYWEEYFK